MLELGDERGVGFYLKLNFAVGTRLRGDSTTLLDCLPSRLSVAGAIILILGGGSTDADSGHQQKRRKK